MNYRVSLEGAGFCPQGKTGSYGFVTNCFVEAPTEDAACALALESARAKVEASGATASAAARVHVEEVSLWSNNLPAVTQQGLIWFEEESE